MLRKEALHDLYRAPDFIREVMLEIWAGQAAAMVGNKKSIQKFGTNISSEAVIWRTDKDIERYCIKVSLKEKFVRV